MMQLTFGVNTRYWHRTMLTDARKTVLLPVFRGISLNCEHPKFPGEFNIL